MHNKEFTNDLTVGSTPSQCMSEEGNPRFPWLPKSTPSSQPGAKRSSAASTSSASTNTRFSMKIGVTVFGTPLYFDVELAVSEFRNFVQANSKIVLEITMSKFAPLALSEYHSIPGASGCTFIEPKYLRSETLAKLPLDAAVQIAIYDIQNTTSCYGGRTYPPSIQTKNVPFIGIPFGGSISRWGDGT